MKYLVKISPVQRNHSAVTNYLNRFLGPQGIRKAKDLTKNGGLVKDDLRKSEADLIASRLRNLGAVVEVMEAPNGEPENGYRLKLIDAGNHKVAVINEVRIITGVGIKESKMIVDNLGVIKVFKDKSEAYGSKEKLENAGAKAIVDKIQNNEPQLDPKPKPTNPEKPYENSTFLVFGEVRLANGKPVSGCTVRAFDRELRSEQFLGESVTDTKGSYRIIYRRHQFKRPEKVAADLVIYVFNKIGKQLITSEIYFNASLELRKDFSIPETVPLEPSKFEWLSAHITPLLDGASITDLTHRDIWFLENKTEHSFNEISLFADDARLTERTDMPEAVFFALATEDIGVILPMEFRGYENDDGALPILDLPIILEEPVDILMAALDRAIIKNTVPPELFGKKENIKFLFNELNSSGIEESIGLRRRRLTKLGQTAGLSDQTAAAMARRLVEYKNDYDVWEKISREGIIAQSKIQEVKFTIDLGAVTENNFPLTKALRSYLPSMYNILSLEDLSELKPVEWEIILKETNIDPPRGKSVSDYALELVNKVENLLAE